MDDCWHAIPRERPDFRSLADQLQAMLAVTSPSKPQIKRDKYYNTTEIDAYVTNKKDRKKAAKK